MALNEHGGELIYVSTSIRARGERVAVSQDEIKVMVNGQEEVLKSKDVVLTHNEEAFLIHSVFPGGQMVAYPAEINNNAKRLQVNGNFVQASRDWVLLEPSDIRAVKVECFYGFCENVSRLRRSAGEIRYKTIYGFPVCDAQAVKEFALKHGYPEDWTISGCRNDDSFLIYGIFSDGTIYSGKETDTASRSMNDVFFNPFPPTLREYRQFDSADARN